MPKTYFVFLLLVVPLLVGCSGGGSEGPTQTGPDAPPQILNLTITPNVVCVGEGADVTFQLTDANSHRITWTAGLSATQHGVLSSYTGTAVSGERISLRFSAANSGRHQHRIKAIINAIDEIGQVAAPVEVEFFVFDC